MSAPPGLGARALRVAPRLLGAVIRVIGPEGAVGVRLTEVEAYEGEADPGSHAYHGRTRRNAVMFGPPGRLYVYRSYGIHLCVNVVCAAEGTASAVLLRAGEVVEGGEVARARRGAAARERDLARGPGNLGSALGIALDDWGAVLGAGRWDLAAPPLPAPCACGPRVGVKGLGGDPARYPWRFWIPGDQTVSAYHR